MMLLDWLERAGRPRTRAFDVLDVRELQAPDEEVVTYLADRLVHARTDPEFLRRMTEAVGWDRASARVRTEPTIGAKGDLGEVLTIASLEDFDQFEVPVVKLRYQISAQQTLPGTDIVAFVSADDDSIERLHFVETKLRTGRDNDAATAAHKQLADRKKKAFADILDFIGERLYEKHDGSFDVYEDYLANRDSDSLGSYEVSLVWESAEWNERVIDELDDADDLVDPLRVSVTGLSGLQELAEAVFARAGIEMTDDED
jgi:hypothetical protein